jgi:hypothetical protein
MKPPRLRVRPLVVAIGVLSCSVGTTACASLTEIERTPFGPNFPPAPGRTYYLKKSLFGTTILVCDAGPRDAVCFEKPN